MCDVCVEWNGKKWHVYGTGSTAYYERTDKSVKPKRTVRLHRALWVANFGEPPEGFHVHHKDGNKLNNDLANLECISNADHMRHHYYERGRIEQPDWSTLPFYTVQCSDCLEPIQRKRPAGKCVCAKCSTIRAEEKRKVDRICAECGTPFRSRFGNFCSQRCVNLATCGGTVSVLPEGGGNSRILRERGLGS